MEVTQEAGLVGLGAVGAASGRRAAGGVPTRTGAVSDAV